MIHRLAPEFELGSRSLLFLEMQADQWYYGETGGVGEAQTLSIYIYIHKPMGREIKAFFAKQLRIDNTISLFAVVPQPMDH